MRGILLRCIIIRTYKWSAVTMLILFKYSWREIGYLNLWQDWMWNWSSLGSSSRKKTITISEWSTIIRADESRRSVILETQQVEGAAMCKIEKYGGPGQNWRSHRDQSQQPANRDGLWHTRCRKPRHTMENCFKLHGNAQVLSRKGEFRGPQQTRDKLRNGGASSHEKSILIGDEILTKEIDD